mmetsp:Transcript_13312/g.22555  ORF Transcript_13312/g.22555 Transcript_13312/m.22555 type:complete len:214 (-) Transcript_13312:94-735(-)
MQREQLLGPLRAGHSGAEHAGHLRRGHEHRLRDPRPRRVVHQKRDVRERALSVPLEGRVHQDEPGRRRICAYRRDNLSRLYRGGRPLVPHLDWAPAADHRAGRVPLLFFLPARGRLLPNQPTRHHLEHFTGKRCLHWRRPSPWGSPREREQPNLQHDFQERAELGKVSCKPRLLVRVGCRPSPRLLSRPRLFFSFMILFYVSCFKNDEITGGV